MVGDPTVSTREKGEILWEETIANLIELAEEFRSFPVGERVDHHPHGSGGAKLDA